MSYIANNQLVGLYPMNFEGGKMCWCIYIVIELYFIPILLLWQVISSVSWLNHILYSETRWLSIIDYLLSSCFSFVVHIFQRLSFQKFIPDENVERANCMVLVMPAHLLLNFFIFVASLGGFVSECVQIFMIHGVVVCGKYKCPAGLLRKLFFCTWVMMLVWAAEIVSFSFQLACLLGYVQDIKEEWRLSVEAGIWKHTK